MAKATLTKSPVVVNTEKTCTDNTNSDTLSINDFLENINILLNYIMKTNIEKDKKIRHDLTKLQKNHFMASVSNVDLANKTMGEFQNWMLVLGIAELTFLGTLLSRSETGCLLIFIKILLTVLLVGMVLFLFGALLQYKHVLKIARMSYKKSNLVIDYISEIGETIVDEIPEHLKVEIEKGITTSMTANYLIYTGFFFEILVTISTVILIIAM